MIYKKINSKIIIARLFDSYNLDYSAFISRVPNWVFRAMRELSISNGLNPKIVKGTVEDYKCAIPDNAYELVAISYNGLRLPRLNKINENVNTDMEFLIHPKCKYQLDNNGNIITTFKEGDIKFYIKSIPSELDTVTNLRFPLIPDNEELINAIEWYILLRLVYRGHKILNLSLNNNNEFTNPALAWEKYKKRARNSIATLDEDDKKIITDLNTSFIKDYDNYYTGSFNSQYSND